MNWAIQVVKTELKLNPDRKPEFKTLMISFKNVDFRFENNGFVVPLKGKRVYIPVYVPKKYYKWIVNTNRFQIVDTTSPITSTSPDLYIS
ncbi:hypothetical protein [Archaeoglobus sp.]